MPRCKPSVTANSLLVSAAFTLMLTPDTVQSEELLVGKVCPVTYQNEAIGILVFSREWYHSSRGNAQYIAGDNATGVGLEIHLFSNARGELSARNIAQCNKYRLLQIRTTSARLLKGEKDSQIDVPDHFTTPFYDNRPLEHGYGVHLTPADNSDKPWIDRPTRASTVAIYDTPYVSDAYGIEGEDIDVSFETCAVCERDQGYDSLLSCGSRGYRRDYMGGMTGWSEAEFSGVQCQLEPTENFKQILDSSNRIEYSYWINLR